MRGLFRWPIKEPSVVAKTKEPINPFYVLLVVLGVIFFVTAVAYWQMAYRAIAPAADKAATGHQLMTFLDENGMPLLAAELLLLAGATFGAMWLDQRRLRRAESARGGKPAEPSGNGEPNQS